MIRTFDILLSMLVLLIFGPLLMIIILLVWFQDYKTPFYLSARLGKGGIPFTMVKIRSMVVNADAVGGSSTSNSDHRITPLGRFIRKFKVDEISQFFNVLTGSMSVVGPRPQVVEELERYTAQEKQLLRVRPGITDFASIVFSDEGQILADQEDPDLAYHQLIRPGKSRLGLFYVQHASLILNIRLIFLTAVAIVSREHALNSVAKILDRLQRKT